MQTCPGMPRTVKEISPAMAKAAETLIRAAKAMRISPAMVMAAAMFLQFLPVLSGKAVC